MRLILCTICAGLFMPAQCTWAQEQKPTKPERIGLWNKQAPLGDGKFEETEVWLTIHRSEKPNGTAMVICPGGGYGVLGTGAEGHGIATWLNRHGITGCVLEYRLPAGRNLGAIAGRPAGHSHPSTAKARSLDPGAIGIIGFSAGGHLASTAGTRFDDGAPDSADPVQRISCRPDFVILVYPVITMGEKTHGGSRTNLLGKNPDAKLVDLFSNEKQVTDKHRRPFSPMPRTTVWCRWKTASMFFDALKTHKVPPSTSNFPRAGTVSMAVKVPCGRPGRNGRSPGWPS